MKKKFLILVIIQILSVNIWAKENKYFLDFNTSDFEVSSYLKEGSVEYSAKCLSAGDELPWVPEKPDNASIVINNCDTKDIVISSGYVKSDRPDLYEKNSRPKTVVIEYLDSNKKKTVELKDTSDPQLINIFLPEQKSEPFKLVFSEVYKGIKYSDLCINYICKGIVKRQPTKSIENMNQLAFTSGEIGNVEPFWGNNVKIKTGKNEFLIYNNNGFPEIRFNGIILNLDMKMSYAECVKISKKSESQFEIMLSCDNEKETFLFDLEDFSMKNMGLVRFNGKC